MTRGELVRSARWTIVAMTLMLAGCQWPAEISVRPTIPPPDPVIFVHGWNSSASIWATMESDFVANGFPQERIYTWDYNALTQSNVTTAEQFSALVDDVLATHGADQVDVVAHSMGGLSTRHCIKFGDCAGKVDAWVSMGGPNHGTSTASLCTWLYVTCEEMAPGSTFLDLLNEGGEVTEGADRWYTMWTPNDGVIDPPESTLLDGATNIQISSSLTHNNMYDDPDVIEQVAQLVIST